MIMGGRVSNGQMSNWGCALSRYVLVVFLVSHSFKDSIHVTGNILPHVVDVYGLGHA